MPFKITGLVATQLIRRGEAINDKKLEAPRARGRVRADGGKSGAAGVVADLASPVAETQGPNARRPHGLPEDRARSELNH